MRTYGMKRCFFLWVVALCIAGTAMVETATAKSLYLSAEHHQSLFDAWGINPDGTVTKQATYNLQHSTDPAGIAIDSDSETIFITSEFSGGVELVDPVTLTYIGVSSGPSDLAGIDVDDVRDIVYAVKRRTDDLYAFDWDPTAIPSPPPQVNESEYNTTFPNRNIFASTGCLVINGSLGPGGDRDIFEISGLGSAPIDIEVISGTFDTILGLFNAGGSLIRTNDDGGAGLLSKLSSVTPDNGTVRIGITGYSDFGFHGSHSRTGSYAILVGSIPGVLTLRPGYPINLPNCSGAYGIALDELTDILWVADTAGGVVRAYDVSTWTEDTSKRFAPSHKPVDVAVDRVRGFVYTVSMSAGASVPPGTGSNYLSKYDLTTRTETTVNMGHQGVGIAVDEISGFVYVTGASGADNLEVWDTSTSPWTQVQATGDIGNPAGIAIGNVSYNPLNLAKDDIIVGEGVYIGQNFTYEITCDNTLNPNLDATDVSILDTLPVELDFLSATEGGVYDPPTHTVFWDIGTIPAGGAGPTIDLVVRVNENAEPNSTIYNYSTIYYTIGGVDSNTPVVEGEGDPNDEGTYIVPTVPVDVDIKPRSCPNPLNVKSKGVLPVAILGTEDFDVTTIDVTSVRLADVAPIRSNYEDVAAPLSDGNECECTKEGADGYTDLTLKFETQDIVSVIGEVDHGDVLSLTLTGALYGETPIQGVDCIVIRGKHKPFNTADINKDGVVDTADFALLSNNWLQSSVE